MLNASSEKLTSAINCPEDGLIKKKKKKTHPKTYIGILSYIKNISSEYFFNSNFLFLHIIRFIYISLFLSLSLSIYIYIYIYMYMVLIINKYTPNNLSL